jgi:hypothetical protein
VNLHRLMERDVKVALVLLAVLFGSIPTMILFARFFSGKKGDLDSSKSKDQTAQTFQKTEPTKKDPFPHDQELQTAYKGYHDGELNEELPPFTFDDILKAQEDENKSIEFNAWKELLQNNYISVFQRLLSLQADIFNALKSNSKNISSSIEEYKKYSAAVREKGYKIIENLEKFPIKRDIIWCLIRATYIPFNVALIKILSKNSFSSDIHKLLTKGEGAFLQEPGKEEIAIVNTDSTLLILFECISKDGYEKDPLRYNNLKLIFACGSPALEYYLKLKDFDSKFKKSAVTDVNAFNFPLTPQTKASSKKDSFDSHFFDLHKPGNYEEIGFIESITLKDVFESDILSKNEADFLKIASKRLLKSNAADTNFTWKHFKLENDLKTHIDTESFNKNIVYGLIQLIYQKATLDGHRHFSRTTILSDKEGDQGGFFFNPTAEIDPRTGDIAAACHHHQFINKIGITTPLAPFPDMNFFQKNYIENPDWDKDYGKAMGIAMIKCTGEIIGRSASQLPEALLKNAFANELAKRAMMICIMSRVISFFDFYYSFLDRVYQLTYLESSKDLIKDLLNSYLIANPRYCDPYSLGVVLFYNGPNMVSGIKGYLELVVLIQTHFSKDINAGKKRLEFIYFLMHGSPTFPIRFRIIKDAEGRRLGFLQLRWEPSVGPDKGYVLSAPGTVLSPYNIEISPQDFADFLMSEDSLKNPLLK